MIISWKKYINKHERERSNISGSEHELSIRKNVENTMRGDQLFTTESTNPLAWKQLICSDKKYNLYKSNHLHFCQSGTRTNSSWFAICSVISSHEQYVDEWVDYHIVLADMYLFEGPKEHWMCQWVKKKSHSANISVSDFPGNTSDLSYIAKA
jgi:hypothetical protein